MPETSLHEKLISLGADKLASILVEYSHRDEALESKINLAILKNDPNKLIKNIKSKISGITRRKPSFNRYYASELAAELSDIVGAVTNDLFPQKPLEALQIMDSLLNKADKIHGQADDSYGDIGGFFCNLSKNIGKCWALIENRGEHDLATQVFENMLSNDYGEKDNLISDMSEALGNDGLDKLKNIFLARKEEYENGFCKIDGPLRDIADAKDDPDEYMSILIEKGDIRTHEVCEVARRLIASNRVKEAINWLLEKPNNIRSPKSPANCDLDKIEIGRHQEVERYQLLLLAYEMDNCFLEMEELAWRLFELTLSKKYFDAAIKNKVDSEKVRHKDIAVSICLNKSETNLLTSLMFLEELNELSIINKLILNNHDTLNKDYYYFYRPLSIKLFENKYSLASCILRRKLVEGVLEKAQSKYYNYAVSDYSCAKKYAEKVDDWLNFDNHANYLAALRQNHGRKPSFWSKMREKGFFD